MTIFDNILERMAEGQLTGLYAKPILSLEHNEILFYEGSDPDRTLIIDSCNQIPVCGTIYSLNPGISVLETAFQGRTEIHYSLDRKILSGQGSNNTSGLLICCNGAEIEIPLHIVSGETDEAEITETDRRYESEEEQKSKSDYYIEKKHVVGLAESYLSFLCAVKKKAEDEMIAETIRQMSSHVAELCAIRPECIRYRLFEAILAAKKNNLSYAGSLERRMRNIITSARKTHPTEFCLLRYLQYEIARMDKDYTEAGSKKNQLTDYLYQALEGDVVETELICLFGEESLNLMESDPVEFWEKLHELYEKGCNSPFLYFYGICVLQSPCMEEQQNLFSDSFILQCLRAGARYGMVTRQSAEHILNGSTSLQSPYLLHLYRRLYELYPEREMLLPLCRLMIQMDIRSENAFPYYQKAVKEKLKPARLYDYYMYSLPENWDKPIEKEILLYYSADSYVNPAIYLKLCVNILQFYSEKKELMDLYSPHMEAFIRTQISYGRVSAGLAWLVDETVTPQMLDDSLKNGIIPMVFMVRIYADVPDGTIAVYDTGIYSEPQQGTFKNKIAFVCMTGGCGSLRLFNEKKQVMAGNTLEVTPIIQNEELIIASLGIENNSRRMTLWRNAKWLKRKYGHLSENSLNLYYDASEPENIQTCIDYLTSSELSDELKGYALRYVMDHVPEETLGEYEKGTGYSGVIFSHMDLLEREQAAKGFAYLVDHDRITEAAGFWNRTDGQGLDPEKVHALAKKMLLSYEEKDKNILEKILISLLDKDELDEQMLEFLADSGYRPMETQVRILMTCRNQNVNHLNLSAQILMRQLLLADADWSVLQIAYEELVNHEQYEVMNHAALNAICYAYLFDDIHLDIDLAAFVQGEILFSGKTDTLSDYTKLAFIKQMGQNHDSTDSVVGIRRQICQDILKKRYILDFTEREAALTGLPFIPAFTVNLSEKGIFGEDMTDMVRTYPEKLRAEYRLKDKKIVFPCELQKSCENLYSAQIVCFAGEQIQYRVHFGEKSTDWIDMEPWNYPVRNPQGLSERYCMLQNMSVQLENGDLKAETLQNYEVTMKLIHEYGKIL